MRGTLIAAVLVSATLGLVACGPGQTSGRAYEAQHGETWVQEIGAFTGRYNEVQAQLRPLASEIDTFARRVAGISGARPDRASVSAWARDMRARLATHRADIARLPTSPDIRTTDAPANLRQKLELMVSTTVETSASRRTLMQDLADRAGRLVAIVERIATGDPAATVAFDIATQDFNIVMQEGQAAGFKSVIDTQLLEGEPKQAVTSAMMHVALAMADMHRALKALVSGERFDFRSCAAQLRQNADAVKRDAADIRGLMAERRSYYEGRPSEIPPELLDRMKRANETYPSSAGASHRLAAQLLRIATAIEARDMTAISNAGSALTPDLQRLAEDDIRRREIELGR